ncbi:MAG: YihY/virulence factor BrkB family protein [Actinomycetota bacterium]|jgi:membrane protein|nr:YihY/virulence factor BrkB family protein [Actinomycetota bacterium]
MTLQSETGRGTAGADLPGYGADRPTEIPKEAWLQIVKRAWAEAKDDNVPLLAAGAAFYTFLALFPTLIAAITLYGLVADPAQVEAQVAGVASGLPAEARTILVDQMRSVAQGSSRSMSFGLVASLLGALWAASGGMANMMKAINLAYDEKETRGFLKLRAVALGLTLGGVVFLVAAVGLVAVLPVVLDALGLSGVARFAVGAARWLGLVALVMVALAVVYRYAPDRDNPKFRWTSIGAVVATVLWLVGSAAFSVYVSNFGSYGKTYGALAGVVVLLLWLFLTSYIILLGAEINSEMEHQTARDTTEGPEKPMGERRAVMADTMPER